MHDIGVIVLHLRNLAVTAVSAGTLCMAALPASAATSGFQAQQIPAPKCLEVQPDSAGVPNKVYNNCGGPDYSITVTFAGGEVPPDCQYSRRGHMVEYPKPIEKVGPGPNDYLVWVCQ
jgi:hypothetical protein